METEFILLDDFMSVGEAAKILGISRQGVHARIERGKFERVYYILGDSGKKTYYFRRQDVESLVA